MQNINFEYFYYYSHERDTAVTLHRHAFFEMVYYLKGRGTSRVGDELELSYEKGDVIIYPPNVFHNETHEEDTSVICIAFRGEELGKLAAPRKYPDDNSAVMNIIERMQAEIKHRKFQFKQMLGTYIEQILITLSRLSAKREQSEESLDFIQKIISQNLTLDIDLNALADLSGYSYHRFRHIFKEKFGRSPKHYILEKRLESAKKLLLEEGASVSDVALACGFASFSAFSQFFKQQVGTSPRDYQRNNRAQ